MTPAIIPAIVAAVNVEISINVYITIDVSSADIAIEVSVASDAAVHIVITANA